MPLSRDGRAAVGRIVIEMTWIEYQVTRLCMMGEELDEQEAERSIRERLISPADFRAARRVTRKFNDEGIAERTRAWLHEARVLRDKRNAIVHSIVMNEHRPGLTGFWPRGELVISLSTSELVALSEQIKASADEATIWSLSDWPIALGKVAAGDEGS